MTSPLGIPQGGHSSQDSRFADNGINQLESTSYGSNCTELSIPSRDVIVADRWIVSEKIGQGAFGEVFKVRDINTNHCYAIKREILKTKHSQLKYESTMYGVLSGGVGIPRCLWHGQFDGFECIVMDLLGPNVSQVRQNVSLVELDITVDLACQMVSIVEDIHNRGVVVRDIKPDNFLFSSKHQLPETETIETIDEFGMPLTSYKKQTCKQIFDKQWGECYPRLYAVDFGLACYWRDPETGKTHPDTKKHIRSKTGTARYASINVHRGRSHSRRDDVESIGYIVLDLLMGTLPWTGIHAKNSKAGWDRMHQLKRDTFMSDLCAGLPNGVLKFVEYPRKLQFGDQPDYEKMRQYLRGSLPGGDYSDLVKSPFGGQTKSTDNYDIIQQELKQLQENQLQQQQQILDQCSRMMEAEDNNRGNEDRSDVFNMDDMTQRLAKTTVKDEGSQQRKTSTTSQSSIQRLLKENLTKAVGWNTYKHDQAPWNPKTDWANDDEQVGDNSARSWGDDHQELGTWGVAPTSQLDPTDSWGKDDDVNEVNWHERTPWKAAPTAQRDENELETNMRGTTNWGEQSPWDTTQHSQKGSRNDITVTTSWGEEPSWKTAASAIKHDKQHSKHTPVETMWKKWDDRETTTMTNQDHMDSWNRNKTSVEQQWKESTPWTMKSKHSNDDAMKSTWRTIQQPGALDQMKHTTTSTHLNNNETSTYKKKQQQQQLDKPTRKRYHSQPQRRFQSQQNNPSKYMDYASPRSRANDNNVGDGSYQQQRPFTDTTNTQVDGWQRKPGSNSWQQK
ncbi:unnamed protein product [Absidia cylindrospora]